MVSLQITPEKTGDRATELAERGWRVVESSQPDGTIIYQRIPLTSEQFLHPQLGDRLPNSTFHDTVADDAKDMLKRRYANDRTVGIFRDLLIGWDIPNKADNCPDVFLAFKVYNPEQNRSKFVVENEGTRPALIIEVVSPRYRKEDREIKVVEYAQARVQEYVIIDRRTSRQQVLEEVLGYRLVSENYQPITPDEEGRILCETVGLFISLRSGRIVMEDAQTGDRLQTSLELKTAYHELEATNALAQQQIAEMAALLAQYKERFGDLS